jgi:hypothetical protein
MDAEMSAGGTSAITGLLDAELIARYEAIRLKARTAEQQSTAAELERRCRLFGVVRAGAIQYAWSNNQQSLVRTELGCSDLRRSRHVPKTRKGLRAATVMVARHMNARRRRRGG